MLRLGWTRDRKPLLTSGEPHGWGRCEPTLSFRLAIFDPDEYDRVNVPDVFDARIRGRDPSLGCPERIPRS